MNQDLISKTAFLKFEQCDKAFFFYKRHPQLQDQLDPDKKLTFRRGHEVGHTAWELFPGGIDASEGAKDTTAILENTSRLLSEGARVIYEAAFIHSQALVLIDIICLQDNKWTAYEVKSSLKVSENYLKDAYLQYYVLKQVLPAFDDLFLVTLNPDYILEGELEPRKLFRKRSVKVKAEGNFPYFEHRLREASLVLEKNAIPDIPIGKHCFRPYRCDYFGTCWKSASSPAGIFNLPLVGRNTMLEWYNAGIREIGQIPDELITKPSLRLVRDAYKSGEPIINRAAIGDFLTKVSEPMAAIDLEIWNPAIPKLQGTRPFEQIPFLVSLFNGQEFRSFYSESTGDGREDFAEKLVELCSPYASLIVYDKTLEAMVLDNLSSLYPRLAAGLKEIKTRLVDIFEIFLNLHYYQASFRNNFSLKVISSLLVKDISYPSINSGLEAMNLYEQYRKSDNPIEREMLKSELIEYCNTDCLATYKLFEFLRGLERKPGVVD